MGILSNALPESESVPKFDESTQPLLALALVKVLSFAYFYKPCFHPYTALYELTINNSCFRSFLCDILKEKHIGGNIANTQ